MSENMPENNDFSSPQLPPPAFPQDYSALSTPNPSVSSDEKNMAYLAVLGMILLGFLAPLLVYLVSGEDPAKQYSKEQAREALNFSIMQAIGWFVTILLSFVLIGFILMPFMFGWFVWGLVVGAQAISKGEPAPKYPLTIQFLK